MWRRLLEQLLHTHDTPQRTAAAFALGVFFGFCPLLGLHTVLGLALAFVLRLNRVAVLIGIYSNLPWILPAYYTGTTVAAAALLGVNVPSQMVQDFRAAAMGSSWTELYGVALRLAPLAWAFVIGSTVGAVVLALVAYRLSLAAILARRHHAKHRAEQRDRFISQ